MREIKIYRVSPPYRSYLGIHRGYRICTMKEVVRLYDIAIDLIWGYMRDRICAINIYIVWECGRIQAGARRSAWRYDSQPVR